MPERSVRRKGEKYRLPVDEDGNLVIPYDESGRVDLGRIMRHYRKYVRGKEWTAEYVAMLYSQALVGNDGCLDEVEENYQVTARWVQYMEQHNRVPQDPGRRWILAALLGIPPVLFGLDASNPQEVKVLPVYLKNQRIDIRAIHQALLADRQAFLAGNAQSKGLSERIERLQNEILYGSPQSREQVLRLLSRHHATLAEVLRDRGDYNGAVVQLNKAYTVAKENQFFDLTALALQYRGTVFFQRWDTQPDRKTNRTDLHYAIDDLDAAQALDSYLVPQLTGVNLLVRGMVHAYAASTEAERTQALNMLDQGGNYARRSYSGSDEYVVNLTEQLYHTDKGAALTAIGCANDAIDELTLVYNDPNPISKRRRAINDIYQARAYFERGWYAIAVTLARDALKTLKEIRSSINIARVANLYEDLKQSPYSRNEEVTMLGVELVKAQQPYLFQ